MQDGTNISVGANEGPGGQWLGRFMAIWSGQALSLIGSQLVQFALIWYLTIQTGSATVLALAAAAGLLPAIIVTPFAGAYVDRWKRRHVMIAADGLTALSTVVLVVLFASGMVEIWHIVLILLFRSLFAAFHWPASQAATTLLVPEKHLGRVAGMNQSLFGLASILAPPLGAVLLAFLDMQWVLAVDVLTALTAIVPLAIIKIPEPKLRPDKKQMVLQDMRDALRYIKSWQGALSVIGMFMIVNMLATPAFTLMPILVLDHFKGGAIDFATVEAVSGVGMLLGGLALGIWGGTKRKIVTVMGSMALAGVGVALIGFVPSDGFIYVLILSLAVGMMFPILNGAVMAMIQATVPAGMQGRVLALLSSGAMAMSPIGLAIGGPVADSLGIQLWFIIAGTAMTVLGLAAFLMPSVMSIESRAGMVRSEESSS
ncbi:MAG TPA: MFS transporter [Methanomassiliicoccales archaeon]|nr:MFS transporter [Methanomassiliicoccales archaeon]